MFLNSEFKSEPVRVNFRDEEIDVRMIIQADDGPITDDDEERKFELLLRQKRLQRRLKHRLDFRPRMRMRRFHLKILKFHSKVF